MYGIKGHLLRSIYAKDFSSPDPYKHKLMKPVQRHRTIISTAWATMFWNLAIC